MVYTNAEKDDVNKTAIIELDVIPPMGTTTLTNQIKIGAVNTSNTLPIYDFALNLEAAGSQDLNPSNYEIKATSGTKTLIYSLSKSGGNDQLVIDVIYEDASLSESEDGYIEEWEGVDEFQVHDGESTVGLLNDSFTMKYAPPNQNGADPDFSWNDSQEDTTELPDVEIYKEDESSLNNLTQHYLKLITKDGPVVFNIDSPGGSDPVDYDTSSVTINYDGRAGAITYLHVTQNELEIDITS
jgi:hypothetical protein